nr:MAG TPA: hypothetical protein [Caudoviricetes sp.]
MYSSYSHYPFIIYYIPILSYCSGVIHCKVN